MLISELTIQKHRWITYSGAVAKGSLDLATFPDVLQITPHFNLICEVYNLILVLNRLI